jgi:hypothetical protein
MALAKFGKKRQCINCDCRFYDLGKEGPINCPRCNQTISEELDDMKFVNTKYNLNNKKQSDAPLDEIQDQVDPTTSEDGEENDLVSLEDLENEEQS